MTTKLVAQNHKVKEVNGAPSPWVVPKPPRLVRVERVVPVATVVASRVEECADEFQYEKHVEDQKRVEEHLICGNCKKNLSQCLASSGLAVESFCENPKCVNYFGRTGLVLRAENFHRNLLREEKDPDTLGHAPTNRGLLDNNMGSHGFEAWAKYTIVQNQNAFSVHTRQGRLDMIKQQQEFQQRSSTAFEDNPRIHYVKELFRWQKKAIVLGWREEKWEQHTSTACDIIQEYIDTKNPFPSYDLIRDLVNAYLVHVGVPQLLPERNNEVVLP